MCKFPPHFYYAGGERSFTTVALTLAIGEWANCPFRALDEFDVFADSVTRTVSLASLFGFARHCHELQVWSTPQASHASCGWSSSSCSWWHVGLLRASPLTDSERLWLLQMILITPQDVAAVEEAKKMLQVQCLFYTVQSNAPALCAASVLQSRGCRPDRSSNVIPSMLTVSCILQTNENIESIDRQFVHVVRMAPARANAVHS